ncbi:hypothetical protein LTS10_002823 [Elasticomyces elasticus]|nr:hypothetical protein LTS10_002823 [Elasticomyces elasticus]
MLDCKEASHLYTQDGDLRVVFVSGLWCNFSKRLFGGDEPKVKTEALRKANARWRAWDQTTATPTPALSSEIVGDDADYVLDFDLRGEEVIPFPSPEDEE